MKSKLILPFSVGVNVALLIICAALAVKVAAPPVRSADPKIADRPTPKVELPVRTSIDTVAEPLPQAAVAASDTDSPVIDQPVFTSKASIPKPLPASARMPAGMRNFLSSSSQPSVAVAGGGGDVTNQRVAPVQTSQIGSIQSASQGTSQRRPTIGYIPPQTGAVAIGGNSSQQVGGAQEPLSADGQVNALAASSPATGEELIGTPDDTIGVPAALEVESPDVKLTDAQRAAKDRLAKDFTQTIRENSADPTNPDPETWAKYQRISDELYRTLNGHDAYLAQQIQTNRETAKLIEE